MVQIEIVLRGRTFSEAYKVWGKISSHYKHDYIDEIVIDGFTGKKINFPSVSEYLLKKKSDSFIFDMSGASIEFSYIPELKFSRLDIKNLATSVASAESLVSELINEPSFIQGRLYDYEYDLWQNMEDVSYYESECREHSILPKINNGLPFPLEREVIDISKNPGRWELKNGYIESVGSTIWLNRKFAMEIGADISAIQNDSNFDIVDLGRSIKIKAQDQCFKLSAGREAELQNSLRAYIFKNKEAAEETPQ